MSADASEDGSPIIDTAGDTLQRKRIAIFLAVTFAISWSVAAAIYLMGGLGSGPEPIPGLPLWLLLLAGPYMWGPAIGHLATRWVTDEGFDRRTMLLRLGDWWPAWLAGWLGPLVLIVAGGALYFLLFPEHFGGMAQVEAVLETAAAQAGQEIPLTPATFLAIQVASAVFLAPILNAFSTFGEEFGWRAYLLPKLGPLGWRRALVVHGVVWGVWHWPVIAMGYNYGFDYPGAPWLGLLTMAVATVALGVFLGWITLRSASVGPAVVGHAMINGAAGLTLLFATAVPNPVLGPTPVALVGVLPWFVVAAVLLVRRDWLLGRLSTEAPTPTA